MPNRPPMKLPILDDAPRNKQIRFGILAILLSECAVALLVGIGLVIVKEPIFGNIKWFATIFIIPILLLRHYAKQQANPALTKSMIVTLFLTFIVFFACMVKTNI